MSRLTTDSFDWCPDDAARERELNTPREIDPESDKPHYQHRAITWEQLRKVIETNPPFERSEK